MGTCELFLFKDPGVVWQDLTTNWPECAARTGASSGWRSPQWKVLCRRPLRDTSQTKHSAAGHHYLGLELDRLARPCCHVRGADQRVGGSSIGCPGSDWANRWGRETFLLADG